MKAIKIKRSCSGGGKSFKQGRVYKIPKDLSLDLAKDLLAVPNTAEEAKKA